jgi:two-component system chemotaxis response regulator CheB
LITLNENATPARNSQLCRLKDNLARKTFSPPVETYSPSSRIIGAGRKVPHFGFGNSPVGRIVGSIGDRRTAENAMANRDILAIGTSAGGVQALTFLARQFQPEFPASVLVTIHLPSEIRSSLDEVLSRAGPLPAQFAGDGDVLNRGRIYVAPPNRHLIVDGYRLALGEGARENNARPAIDPMLRSAAVCCGARTVGVVLTGTMGDGASGLWAVRRAGGISVVQDPEDAEFSEMPLSALQRGQPDHVVRLAGMPALLNDLVRQQTGAVKLVPRSLKFEVDIARGGHGTMDEMDSIGRRSVLACPDCGGVMWEIDEGELSRFRCHVGHAYTAEMMSLALDENLRRALARAERALEERAALARKLNKQALHAGHMSLAETWAERVREIEREMDIIRISIRRMDRLATDVDAANRAAAE